MCVWRKCLVQSLFSLAQSHTQEEDFWYPACLKAKERNPAHTYTRGGGRCTHTKLARQPESGSEKLEGCRSVFGERRRRSLSRSQAQIWRLKGANIKGDYCDPQGGTWYPKCVENLAPRQRARLECIVSAKAESLLSLNTHTRQRSTFTAAHYMSSLCYIYR